jgi:hypothetical protein
MNCENNNNDDTNDTSNTDMMNDWRLKSLYIDTEHFCAPKKDEIITSDRLLAHQNMPQKHPSSLPVILKDTTRPYTYYTMKSYGHAQDKNYYVNFDDHVTSSNTSSNNNSNIFETEPAPKVTFENSGCVKTYLCSLLGCFACCLLQFKPI